MTFPLFFYNKQAKQTGGIILSSKFEEIKKILGGINEKIKKDFLEKLNKIPLLKREEYINEIYKKVTEIEREAIQQIKKEAQNYKKRIKVIKNERKRKIKNIFSGSKGKE